MPELNELKRKRDIGRQGHAKVIWIVCPACGKRRWVTFNKGISGRCLKCSGQMRRGNKNYHWKGGRYKDVFGYIHIKLQSDDFFYSMTNKQGYIREHRLIMARYLNRCLLPWEVVHHKNGIKDDNKIENLQLFPTPYKHDVLSSVKSYIVGLEEKIKFLENKLIEAEEGRLAR